MIRKIVIFLGVVMLVAGGWIVRLENASSSSCNSNSAFTGGYGASSKCVDVMGHYFYGFAFIVAGLFTVLFALLMTRRVSRLNTTTKVPHLDIEGKYGPGRPEFPVKPKEDVVERPSRWRSRRSN